MIMGNRVVGVVNQGAGSRDQGSGARAFFPFLPLFPAFLFSVAVRLPIRANRIKMIRGRNHPFCQSRKGYPGKTGQKPSCPNRIISIRLVITRPHPFQMIM